MQRSSPIGLKLTSVMQPLDQESLKARLVGFDSKQLVKAVDPKSTEQPLVDDVRLNRLIQIGRISVLSEIAEKTRMSDWPKKTVGLFAPTCAEELARMLQLADKKDEKQSVNDGVLIQIIKKTICERVDQGKIKTEQEGTNEIGFFIKTLLAIINVQFTPNNLKRTYEELEVVQILLPDVQGAISVLTKDLEKAKLTLIQDQKRFDELQKKRDDRLRTIDEECKITAELIAKLKKEVEKKQKAGNQITADFKLQSQTRLVQKVMLTSPKMSEAEREKMSKNWLSAEEDKKKILTFEGLLKKALPQRKSESDKFDDQLKTITTEIKMQAAVHDQVEQDLNEFKQEEKRLLNEANRLTALADPVILRRTQEIPEIFNQRVRYAGPIEYCLDKDVKEYLDEKIERILFSKAYANIDKIRSSLLAYSSDDETVKLQIIDYHEKIADILNGIIKHAEEDARVNIFTDFLKCLIYIASDKFSKKTIADLGLVLNAIAKQLFDKSYNAQHKVKRKKHPVHAMLIASAYSEAEQKLSGVDLSFHRPLVVQVPDNAGQTISPTPVVSPAVGAKELALVKPPYSPSTVSMSGSPTLAVGAPTVLVAAPSSPLMQSSVFSLPSATSSSSSASPGSDEKQAKHTEGFLSTPVAIYKSETLRIMESMDVYAKLELEKERQKPNATMKDAKHSETSVIVNSYGVIAQSKDLLDSVTAFRQKLQSCMHSQNRAAAKEVYDSEFKKYKILDSLILSALKVLGSYEPKKDADPNTSKLIMMKFLSVQLNQLCIGGVSELSFNPEKQTEELVGLLKCMLSKSNSMMRKREFFKYFKETMSVKSGAYISSLEAAILFAESADPKYKKIKPFTLTPEVELKYDTLLNAVLEHNRSVKKHGSGRAP